MTRQDRRWLFADQLGPHFLDDGGTGSHGTGSEGIDDGQPVLLIEARKVFERRVFHRRKAHLVLSALRHRAVELGDRVVFKQTDTYRQALDEYSATSESLSVCAPTTYAARRFVNGLQDGGELTVLPARGWAIGEQQFATWADRRKGKRLVMEDFYREVRRHHDLLITPDGEPEGGHWNYDTSNREPPPKAPTLAAATGIENPWWPAEDEIDAQVRRDLDRWQQDGVQFLGEDGPRRFAATRDEALAALEHFVVHRLDGFGPHEDAILSGDRWMAHSLLSAPINLGLLDPVEVAERAVRAYHEGDARLESVEGFVRQVIGWREYVWHTYWYFGEDYRNRNGLTARTKIPDWFANLDADGEVEARCLSSALASVREEGWAHHIPRLMVLGNWALQRGYDPAAMTDWFHRTFVDGYDWVMVPNVVGMALHADGGQMMTKPYAAGGAYINKMSDHCKGCRYDPKVRVGENACPFTAGYWAFMERNAEHFENNHRMSQPMSGLRRLKDLESVVLQETARGQAAP